MESNLQIPSKRPKSQKNLNLHVAECIRQFELPQQFPSTVTELRLSKPGLERNTKIIRTKSMQNIISALPLSGKMKFIPNKEVSLSENLQTLKLKLPDGRDLGEVKIVLPGQEEDIQTKLVTMSKVGIKSEKPITWTIKSQFSEKTQKPKRKTLTRMFNSSSFLKDQKESEETSSQVKIEIVNRYRNSSSNTKQNNRKLILSNLKQVSNIHEHKTNKQKFVVHSEGDGIKKFIIKNPNVEFDKQNGQSKLITLKKLSGSKKIIVLPKNNNEVLKCISDKHVSLKSVKQSDLDNDNIKQNLEKIVFRSSLNGSIIRKRSNSVIENLISHENKKPYFEIDLEDSNINEDSNTEFLDSDQYKNPTVTNSVHQIVNPVPRKNVMVIVPNEAAEELTMASSSPGFNNEQVIQEDRNSIGFTPGNEVTAEVRQLQDFVSGTESTHEETTIKSNKAENQIITESESNNMTKIMNDKSAKSRNLFDKFKILEKAVLSVQDTNLRTKALKALKDCGIKVKKTVPLKPFTVRKLINESGTQTKVFSLLKKDEFIHISEKVDNLIGIKQSRMLMKQPITTLYNIRSDNKVNLKQDQDNFETHLDHILDKCFPDNRGILDIKEAFIQNKIIQAKMVLKLLQEDFKAATNYDNDGLLGIHRAVIDDSIQEVQRHMMMLKAAQQNIDICSQDDKTSLELAVEYEVNPQIIKLLLDSGAQPVSSKPIHDSALILAAKTSSKILPLLLKYINRSNRSLLNTKNSEGLAVIHYCAQLGNLVGITDLLKHGADVNLQDERSGRTALFYAVETKNSDVPQEIYNQIAHKLLEHGAVSNIPIFSKHSILSLIDDVKSHSLKIALNRAVK